MPTYEYACSACGHEFEEFQSIKADPIRTCPRCGKRKVERKIGIGGAVIFRGGGFYETDYRSADYEQAKKADAAPTGGSGSDAASTAPSGSVKEQSKATTNESAVAGATAAPSKPTASGGAEGSTAATKESTKESRPGDDAGNRTRSEGSAASGPRKTHAREGRGIGNVLQLGRAKASGAKPASKPSRASAGKGSKRKGR